MGQPEPGRGREVAAGEEQEEACCGRRRAPIRRGPAAGASAAPPPRPSDRAPAAAPRSAAAGAAWGSPWRRRDGESASERCVWRWSPPGGKEGRKDGKGRTRPPDEAPAGEMGGLRFVRGSWTAQIGFLLGSGSASFRAALGLFPGHKT